MFKLFFLCRAQDRDQCLLLILSNFKESLVNLRDHMMRSLLHIAAYQNSVACFDVLLKQGAAINLKDSHNRTPLMLASYMGHQRIVGTSENHSKLPILSNLTDFLLLEILLEKNCDVNVADSSGDTALHIACRRGHEAIASLILKSTSTKSSCISHQNNNGQT